MKKVVKKKKGVVEKNQEYSKGYCSICKNTGRIEVVYRGENGKGKRAYLYCRVMDDPSFEPTVDIPRYVIKE